MKFANVESLSDNTAFGVLIMLSLSGFSIVSGLVIISISLFQTLSWFSEVLMGILIYWKISTIDSLFFILRAKSSLEGF